ncbi:MAG: hypothetical protein ACK42H_19330 [Planctomycetota bacterium]|jgi:hypothetical protein
MGIGLGFVGGLAQGAAQGMKLRSDLDDAEERRKLMREQSAREEKRLGFEEKRLGFEEARSQREEQIFGFTLKDLTRKENRAVSEDQALAELQASFLGTQPANAAAPQGTDAAAPQPVRGVATPIPQTVAAAPAQAIATNTPAAVPPASGAPAAPTSNPFINTVKGAQLDVTYDAQAKALQRYYIAKGDVEKAMQVPKMMKELRDFEWTDKVGASLAAMAGGAPGARESFSKIYGMVNDGYDLDVKSGKFDPQKGWTGLVRINKETGERETFDFTPTQAMMIASKYKNPAEVIKYVQEQADKQRQFGFEERKTTATEKTADASMINAKANASEAGAKNAYYNAYAGYLQRKGIDEADASKQKASVEAAARMFPLVGKEIKQDELMLMEKNDRADILKRKREDEMMFDKTLDLAGLNPKVDVRTLAQVARLKTVDAQKDPDGRVFTTVNGKKIYLQ